MGQNKTWLNKWDIEIQNCPNTNKEIKRRAAKIQGCHANKANVPKKNCM